MHCYSHRLWAGGTGEGGASSVLRCGFRSHLIESPFGTSKSPSSTGPASRHHSRTTHRLGLDAAGTGAAADHVTEGSEGGPRESRLRRCAEMFDTDASAQVLTLSGRSVGYGLPSVSISRTRSHHSAPLEPRCSLVRRVLVARIAHPRDGRRLICKPTPRTSVLVLWVLDY